MDAGRETPSRRADRTRAAGLVVAVLAFALGSCESESAQGSPQRDAKALARAFDACQQEIVQRGAAHLAEWIDRCADVPSALGGYNTGECGVTGYSRRVLTERERLREPSELEREGDVPGLSPQTPP